MPRPQVNIRLTQEQHDVLQAAVFVRGLKSAQDLIGPEVERLVEGLTSDQGVSDALRVRRAARGASDD